MFYLVSIINIVIEKSHLVKVICDLCFISLQNHQKK